MHLPFSGTAFAPIRAVACETDLLVLLMTTPIRAFRLSLLLALVAFGATSRASAQAPGNGAPSEAPAAASHAASVPTPADYRLVRGDKLRVEVYKDDYLSQSLQIRPDGKITLPLIGDVVASGLTPIELRDRIATSLKEYVANPVVTVIVVEVNEPVVYVMGEVNQPGSIALRGPVTVLQALAMAGGFKDFANPKGIRILRRSADDHNRVETIEFNYKDALKPNAPIVYLQSGDTVVVP